MNRSRPTVGRTLGRYEILAERGRGGMGTVYKARDPQINRFVAIKTISLHEPDAAEQPAYRARFFREAEAAGRLSHPRIVTIFDVAEDPDTQTPYIVMEYVSGKSLEEVLSSGALSLSSTLQVIQELAEGLDYAHAQGIVHRDIKPPNILLAEDGHPKITDFGIAKLDVPDVTQPGRIFGTPAYMSPEQLKGEPVDGRSDLFSLGVIFYRLLTGHRPFQGNSAHTVSFKILNRDPVPAAALNAELPAELDYVIAHAIAKDPAGRYQTGMEMALDLQDLRAGVAPRSHQDQRSPETARAEDPLASLKYRIQASQKINTGVTAGKTGISETHILRAPTEEVAPVQFDKPWQQLCISFSTLAFLALAFAGLWRAIPVKATETIATRLSLPAPKPNTTTTPAIGLTGTALASAPLAKPHSAPRRPEHTPHLASPANLSIAVEHHFASANLSVWIDDQLSVSHPLHGAVKKRMVLFKHFQGYVSDLIQVSAGEHHIRVHVLSADNSYDESGNISGNFASGSQSVLTIDFDKDNRQMHLSLQ